MSLVDPKIIQQGMNYHVQHGDDSGLYVEFHMEAVENKEKSIEAGRPIFEDKEYVTIRIAGDSKTVRVRPVKYDWDAGTPPDAERWPRQYQAFKNQQSQAIEGTPLTEWTMITKADAMSMKAMNIHTVEMLAALGDNNIDWLGGRMMRDKAKAWIEQAKDNSGIAKLQEENQRLRNDLEAIKNQLAALGEDKPRRGRPPKEVNDAENAT